MAGDGHQLSPAPPESADCLRLLLNCLYMISEQSRPLRQLKAIYELRTMTLAGYMPDVLACAGCGKYDGGEFYLDPVAGRLLCADCADKAPRHFPIWTQAHCMRCAISVWPRIKNCSSLRFPTKASAACPA